MNDYTSEPSASQALEANFAKPISQLRKTVKRKRNYRKTTAFTVHAAWRQIAAYGKDEYLSWADRSVLKRLVNLWLYHMGRDGYIEPDHKRLERSVGLSERAVRKAISKFKTLGFLVHISGGRGRGVKARYGLDLMAMKDRLWADFAFQNGDESVSLDGEIKGAQCVRDYQTTKKMQASRMVHRRSVAHKIGGMRIAASVEGLGRVMTAMLSASSASFKALSSRTNWIAKFGPIPKAGRSESLRDAHATARTGQPSTWLVTRLNGINPFHEVAA